MNASDCMWEIVFSAFSVGMVHSQKSVLSTSTVVFLFPRYDHLNQMLIAQSVPLHAISSLGINFCTAALGLLVAGKMTSGDLVTITGAAGGTGLAATELSLANGNEVRLD